MALKVADDDAFLDLSDALERQENWGIDPGIQSETAGFIKVRHKAKFATLCCDWCNGSKGRQYFWVLENSFESNYPSSCYCIPPNKLCLGFDSVQKTYFDRGIYAVKDLFCCTSGVPSVHAGGVAHVCLCMDCCDGCNYCLSGYFPYCQGERVSYLPMETFCLCLPTRACWLHNICGLCGPKDGEPVVYWTFATHLAKGEAVKLAHQLNVSRSEWSQRTGHV